MSSMKFCRRWSVPIFFSLSFHLFILIHELIKINASSFIPHRSNNVLYPTEDKEEKLLLYACRNCNHEVPLFSFAFHFYFLLHSFSLSICLHLAKTLTSSPIAYAFTFVAASSSLSYFWCFTLT